MQKSLSVDIVLPVYYGNEPELVASVTQLVTFFRANLRDYKWTIVVSINGKQPEHMITLAKQLSKYYKEVTHLYTPEAGKGYGVLGAWSRRKADIYTYMDIDLSTNLHGFRSLLDGIREGYDLVIGSRYHPDSRTKRALKRYVISRGYILFIYRAILGVPVGDSQCGFKAVNQRVVKELVPLVRDKVWFFESELLYLAHKKGFTIKEIPVVWQENNISGVNLVKIVPAFIKKVIALRFRKLP